MMKHTILKSSLSFLLGILLFTSCNNDEDTDTTTLTLPAEEVQNLLLAENISSEIAVILEDDDFNFSLLKEPTSSKTSTANCAVRTITQDEVNQTKTITLDFGEGCIGERGKKLAGKLITTYQRTANGFTKAVTFDSFFVNDNAIEGTKSLMLVKENSKGNRTSEAVVNLEITLTTGAVISLNETKSREMVEGAGTLRRGDDVFLIGGNATFVTKSGVEFSTTITEKLTKAFACKFISSGVKEMVRNGTVFTLDFGNGACDNIATLTNAKGESKEIRL